MHSPMLGHNIDQDVVVNNIEARQNSVSARESYLNSRNAQTFASGNTDNGENIHDVNAVAINTSFTTALNAVQVEARVSHNESDDDRLNEGAIGERNISVLRAVKDGSNVPPMSLKTTPLRIQGQCHCRGRRRRDRK